MTQVTANIDADALTYILGIPRGRKVIWDLLAIAGLYHQPRIVGDADATSFNCGSLNVGLTLYADCLACSPDLTAMMIKEQGSYDNRNAADPDAASRPDSGDPRSQADAADDGDPDANGLGLNRLTGRHHELD